MDFERTKGLVCRGMDIGGIHLPPFEVGPGEIVKVNFPIKHAREAQQVVDAFCAGNDDRIHTTGRVVTVELPMTRSPFREMFHRQTAAEWLVARRGMNRHEAARELIEDDVNPDAPLCMLAGNPRWMIGFVAAMHQHPSAVAFTTIGCDATGMKKALATVRAQLRTAAGVYLCCFPDLQIEEPVYVATLSVTVRDPATGDVAVVGERVFDPAAVYKSSIKS